MYRTPLFQSIALLVLVIGISIIGWIVARAFWPTPAPVLDTPSTSPVHAISSIERLSMGGWYLRYMTDLSGGVYTSPSRVDVAFTSRRIAGEICNVFSAAMSSPQEGVLSFGPVQSTKKMCDGPLMDIERRMWEGLQQGMTFALSPEGTELSLSVADSGITFVFDWHQ
jgi:hypothetical protein